MLYDIEVENRDGKRVTLSEFKGKVLLVVNTATGCGFTPQYEGLENLYEKYHDKGFEILDFPCDQFGHQAPGSDDEIHEFCVAKYSTTFDQMKKIDVNGDNEHPLYTYLKSKHITEIISSTKNKLSMKAITKISKTYKNEDDIKWNFTKFLINKNGEVVLRYAPTELPEAMESEIIRLLEE